MKLKNIVENKQLPQVSLKEDNQVASNQTIEQVHDKVKKISNNLLSANENRVLSTSDDSMTVDLTDNNQIDIAELAILKAPTIGAPSKRSQIQIERRGVLTMYSQTRTASNTQTPQTPVDLSENKLTDEFKTRNGERVFHLLEAVLLNKSSIDTRRKYDEDSLIALGSELNGEVFYNYNQFLKATEVNKHFTEEGFIQLSSIMDDFKSLPLPFYYILIYSLLFMYKI